MSAQSFRKSLALDFEDPSIAAIRRRRMIWTQRVRHLVQLAFALFIIAGSIAHNLATEDGAVPSIDALCPFGGIETLWRTLSSGGQFVPKTHVSNLVLLAGLVAGTLIAGGAFCGWVCPFGAVQDLMTAIRKRLRLRELRVSPRVDRVLRYGRYVALAVILYQTISSVKLWFADFDPYRTLFGLEWLFRFDLAANWLSYGLVVFVLGTTLFVERGFCRYACPLGGAISVLGRFSLLRIRRSSNTCKGCALCERPCPVKLPVATADTISSDCIGCLGCVEACPREGALEVKLAPAWLPNKR
jgi:polyferredoxin